MKIFRLMVMILGVAHTSTLLVGCSEPNQDVQTDLAKLTLPPGVSDKPVVKPFKSKARVSSPPLSSQAPK